MGQQDEFHLGLCLTGAFSAGAYTAGVVDYLIEALDEWERRKQQEAPDKVPQHSVKLSVIGGASAGGMTGMIMGAALQQRRFDPIMSLNQLPYREAPAIENPFYHAWVDLADSEPKQEATSLMDMLWKNGDLNPLALENFMNTDIVQRIADRIILRPREPEAWRSYTHDPLKVFTALDDLQKLERENDFKSKSGLQPSRTTDYGDFESFSVSSTGTAYTGGERVDRQSDEIMHRYRDVARRTGGSPIGLSPAELQTKAKQLIEKSWLRHISRTKFASSNFSSNKISGGQKARKDPFKKVREELDLLTGINDSESNQSYSSLRSAVLMVGSFPGIPSCLQPAKNLKECIRDLQPAFINRSRTLPHHLHHSVASEKADQFNISPVRYGYGSDGEVKIFGAKAMACGCLGGFGGLLSKSFRIHDFFLGRANCEKFLRDHFTVPQNSWNDLIDKGYEAIEENQRDRFVSKTNKGLQLIPIFSDRKNKPYMPDFEDGQTWPKLSVLEIESYRPEILKRVDLLLSNTVVSHRDRVLFWIGRKLWINRKVTEMLMAAGKISLKDHYQLNSYR